MPQLIAAIVDLAVVATDEAGRQLERFAGHQAAATRLPVIGSHTKRDFSGVVLPHRFNLHVRR
jgi:hypothetical protein